MGERRVSGLLIFGLVVAWGVALLPDFIRRVSDSRRSDTIGQFSRNLGTLERSAPVGAGRSNVYQFVPRSAEPVIDLRDAAPVAHPFAAPRDATRPAGRPVRRSRAQQRRQEVLSALIAASVLAFLATITLGGVFVYVQFVAFVALALYAMAMVSATRRDRLRAQAAAFYRPAPILGGVVALAPQRARVGGIAR